MSRKTVLKSFIREINCGAYTDLSFTKRECLKRMAQDFIDGKLVYKDDTVLKGEDNG